jgi:SagB-type dehydrogenase family enzyme
MSNPFLKHLHTHRNPSDRYLFNSTIGAIKEYRGAEQVSLPVPDPVDLSYSVLARDRQSCREYKEKTVSIEDISATLFWSMSEQIYHETEKSSETQFSRRPYPSGGAKFPIEAYVLTDGHDDLGTAVYHYRPDVHLLEKVKKISSKEVGDLKRSYIYEFVVDIPVMIIFSYIMERNVPKYGTFGTKLALIEAGHIAQNMALVSRSKNVDSIMLAGGDFDAMDTLFGFDSYNESTFYSIGLGKTYGPKV